MDGAGAALPGAAPDSGVDTEGDQESNDSFMSTVSVGIIGGAAAAAAAAGPANPVQNGPMPGPSGLQHQQQPQAQAMSAEESQPAPSTSSAAAATPFPAPTSTASSSLSGSTPATPEPSSQLSPPPPSTVSIGVTANIPPASVNEDGYLGDCSSDGGNEKNFPMPPEKLKRLLCLKNVSGDLSDSSTKSGVDGGDAIEPPAGLSFQNLHQPDFVGGNGYQVGGGGSGSSTGHHHSHHSRKMRGVFRSKLHHNSNQNWSHIKAGLASRKLRQAVSTNNTELMERLLSGGANPNAVDEHSRTALHFAAAKGYAESVSLLLTHGSDPNQKDALGNTPLHLAAVTNNVGVVTLLLRSGTNVTELDNNGRTPMQLAQSKLKILQKSKSDATEMSAVKNEVAQVLEMMREYLMKKGHGTNKAYNDLLNSFSQRLTLHQTQDDINSDLKNLLDSLGNLQVG